ncbi:DMT family transporter [Bordetella bronchiseptica]|uniref:Guanidinium exporter n=2 Tax=Bordetella bronchiseptica TaxID=518 RepID=A0A0H3LJ07_BORBR|nr:multidrug efflux SMR transporter [Bordetella bronchiseptica]AMG87659.1 QacE family quaternary ammonium compound efflux SMR transporter [Bordetella bronchiseptica]AWP74033.1 QacE family quaternary ammonium compound efflux SMR transporter [Bordetella bronchiseptica]AWP83666.1 QacE family quaternary ammonium compound efflux SMR transporter [Bordetella bronchiseptica]AWQ09233.1 QacE family quaternary ammonium compound efflux SMR transporter [Bordetella bronchiseptica]AXT90389.1 QacE family quat
MPMPPHTAWMLLALAGALEIVWALALKQADGLTRLWPSLIGISVAMLSLVLLALALRHLPVGTAYAIWVGIGAFGVAVFGTLVLGEPMPWAKLLFLALIGIGVAGLRMIEP